MTNNHDNFGEPRYCAELAQIQAHVAAGVSAEECPSIAVSTEMMQAMRDFVNAEHWEATRRVIETRQAVLFQPEVERLFEQNITQAQAAGEEPAVKILDRQAWETIAATVEAGGLDPHRASTPGHGRRF